MNQGEFQVSDNRVSFANISWAKLSCKYHNWGISFSFQPLSTTSASHLVKLVIKILKPCHDLADLVNKLWEHSFHYDYFLPCVVPSFVCISYICLPHSTFVALKTMFTISGPFFTDHDNIKSQSANFSCFQSRELLKIVVLKIFPYYDDKRNSKMLWHFDCLFKSDAELNNWGFTIIIRSNFFCICDANKHCNLSQTKVKLWVHLQ